MMLIPTVFLPYMLVSKWYIVMIFFIRIICEKFKFTSHAHSWSFANINRTLSTWLHTCHTFILLLSRKNRAQMKKLHDSPLLQQELARISKFLHLSTFGNRFSTVRLGHYQERLQCLNLYSMEYIIKKGDMIQAYEILKKIDRIDPSKFFTETKYKGTRNHSMKLFKPRFESELRRYAFSQRIIDYRNSLTEKIVNSESLDMFKGRLDKHWSIEWFKISTE